MNADDLQTAGLQGRECVSKCKVVYDKRIMKRRSSGNSSPCSSKQVKGRKETSGDTHGCDGAAGPSKRNQSNSELQDWEKGQGTTTTDGATAAGATQLIKDLSCSMEFFMDLGHHAMLVDTLHQAALRCCSTSGAGRLLFPL